MDRFAIEINDFEMENFKVSRYVCVLAQGKSMWVGVVGGHKHKHTFKIVPIVPKYNCLNSHKVHIHTLHTLVCCSLYGWFKVFVIYTGKSFVITINVLNLSLAVYGKRI